MDSVYDKTSGNQNVNSSDQSKNDEIFKWIRSRSRVLDLKVMM